MMTAFGKRPCTSESASPYHGLPAQAFFVGSYLNGVPRGTHKDSEHMAIGRLASKPGIGGVSRGERVRGGAARPRILRLSLRIKNLLALLALIVLTAVAAGLVFGLILIRAILPTLPSVSHIADLRLSPVTRNVSSDGVLLATFEMQFRRPVALSIISPSLIAATLATEDSRFYAHSGLDSRGILRALWSDLRSGNPLGQGGSRITQQLARNVYLSNEKTLRRKVEEAQDRAELQQAGNPGSLSEFGLLWQRQLRD
jgi:hypothetical protein